MELTALAQFAAKSNYTQANNRKRVWELSIEEARETVKVRDGNRTPAADGSQALVLGLGRHNLGLDVISKGATRVNAAADQVAAFTVALSEAVAAGTFDGEIVKAQAAAKESAEQRATGIETKADVAEVDATVAPDGLDLDSI